jgi:tRNA(Ile)-lysidine synthase
LLQQFLQYVQQHHLFTKKDKLLIAVSGGADSVVLCHLCQQAGFSFAIAHCNFNLRGQESIRDENFVKNLATQYDVQLYATSFDTEKYMQENKLGLQEAARELRYTFFNELLTNHQHNFLLTAHHANDNVETVLMNMVKGTGIKGLRGILPKQHKILRPLLFAKKEDILAFATAEKLLYVEDSSNAKTDYTRNFLRHEVMPVLQKLHPQVEDNMLDSIKKYTQIEAIYDEYIQRMRKLLLEKKGEELHIAVAKLIKQTSWETVLFELLKEYGFNASQQNEIIRLLQAETGKYIASPTHRLIKNRNWLILSRNVSATNNHYLVESSPATINFELGKFSITETALPKELHIDDNTAFVDAKHIAFPLVLRKWRQGDYFYPLGMPKKKKLSKFLINKKLSLTDKEKIWVLEVNKKIIWVVGHRIDDRFKITDQSTNVLKLHLVP